MNRAHGMPDASAQPVRIGQDGKVGHASQAGFTLMEAVTALGILALSLIHI
jgi:type II secretory pathway component PulJ